MNSYSFSESNSHYCGCLFFIDDINSENELKLVDEYSPNLLVRSWYRWGEPSIRKKYNLRLNIGSKLKKNGIKLGGGTSLSVVSEEDIKDISFNKEWLSVDINNEIIKKSGHYFGSLSSPQFRKYLVKKLIEQVRLGVSELHLGETNGEIHFDKWTIREFNKWVLDKYPNKDSFWWKERYGTIGVKLLNQELLNQSDISNLSDKNKENFFEDWGRVGDWKGLNEKGNRAFLYNLYTSNLDSFIGELREELSKENLKVVIDVWGFADWITEIKNKPDAIFTSPPDLKWSLNWEEDADFNLLKHKNRIKSILQNEIRKNSPTPVIIMIDHPKPFYQFIKLPDKRQKEIFQYFSQISNEINTNFVIRSYTNELSYLGKTTQDWLKKECLYRKATNICPSNSIIK
ncbi:MAG: hypothetical protein A2417_16405 [Bdellovibrionales bacterium RIFOXYC1_FULL_37_79]|nr:MAG: hypothetical protein A2417_16405 [Bdellovibrionales bacterium RIFOXYC1_FULL_37_79]